MPALKPQTIAAIGWVLFAVLLSAAHAQDLDQRQPERGIFSEAPAKIWQQAMLSGNGTLGAMVFGNPNSERIVLNHERLYEPLLDQPCPVPKVPAEAIAKSRQLSLAGKYKEAYLHYFNACKQAGFPGIQWTDPYHPACAITLNRSTAGDSSRTYYRNTNFRNGQVSVCCADGQSRQTFVSRADHAIVHQIVSPKSNDSNGATLIQLVNQDQRPKSKRADRFGGGYQDPIVEVADGWITYRCQYDHSARGYAVVLRAVTNGLPTPVETSKKIGLAAQPGTTILLVDICSLEDFAKAESAIAAAKQRLAAIQPDYQRLLDRHTAIHGEMFQRLELSLGPENSQVESSSTESLIADQRATVDDRLNVDMLQKMFDMGRYTLISSSGEWPPNLMGIWNGDWRPMWSGDFTLDANINLQIASANIGNLPEAIHSYDRLIQGLLPDWRTNAANLYSCRGVLAGTRTDGRHNLHTHFSEGFPGSSWVSGAQWLVLPMFEHYQTTGDDVYLREKLLPILIEIAQFYEDYLASTEDQRGRKIFVPSYSPENKPTGADHSSVVNATMDIACCKEVLTQLLSLDEKYVSADRRRRYRALLAKLPEYMINPDGALKEWANPELKDHYDHRHVSHLYPVWPGHEINPEDTPELFTATKIAAAKKGRGNGSAHGLAHMALIGARLKNADLVEGNLRFMLGSGFVLPSFGTYHNVGRIYNLDMLNSLPAVVLEMLVYSRPGEIELLPALPASISVGKITGIACRNQCVIQALRWDLNKGRVWLTVESQVDQTITLRIRRGINGEQVSDVTEQAQGRIDGSTVELELAAQQPLTRVFTVGTSD